MRIAYIAAGAGGMYCGSCIHDNTTAAALQKLGHDVALMPTYTPMRTDEANVSLDRVFYGAVNVYLKSKSKLFQRSPRLLEWLLDRPKLLGWVSKLGSTTDAKDLGDLTLAVLRGEAGPAAGELDKLITWLRDDYRPDVVHITNSMFLGLVHRIRRDLDVPVVVAVQGEDIFLDGLVEPWRSQVDEEMKQRAQEVDAFLAPNRFYAQAMAERLGVEIERFAVISLGINLAGYSQTGPQEPSPESPLTIGYLARICPEKGLHLLIDAFSQLAEREGHDGHRLRIAGYLGERDRRYYQEQQSKIEGRGLADRVDFVGEVDLDGKHTFLDSLDLLSVPTTYREAKGIFAVEAMAAGVPVVLPDHGSFPEVLEIAPGGVLHAPESVPALTDALHRLAEQDDERHRLAKAGHAAVHRHLGAEAMAETTAALYQRLVDAVAA